MFSECYTLSKCFGEVLFYGNLTRNVLWDNINPSKSRPICIQDLFTSKVSPYLQLPYNVLHSGLKNVADNLHTIFSNAFSWTQSLNILIYLHWNTPMHKCCSVCHHQPWQSVMHECCSVCHHQPWQPVMHECCSVCHHQPWHPVMHECCIVCHHQPWHPVMHECCSVCHHQPWHPVMHECCSVCHHQTWHPVMHECCSVCHHQPWQPVMHKLSIVVVKWALSHMDILSWKQC